MNDTTTAITAKTVDKATPTTVLLTVSQVCRRIPGARGNESVNPSTITRWILTGCPGRSGTRIKLVATRAGSRWLIAPSDLEAFFTALTAVNRIVVPPPAPPRTETQRRTASERAARELERRGA